MRCSRGLGSIDTGVVLGTVVGLHGSLPGEFFILKKWFQLPYPIRLNKDTLIRHVCVLAFKAFHSFFFPSPPPPTPFPARPMTGCFFSSRGKGKKCFEDGSNLENLTDYDLSWFCPYSSDHPYHPEAQWGLFPWARPWWSTSKPDRFRRSLDGWGVSSSLYTFVSQFQALLQRSLPGMKLPQGDEGSWAAGDEGIFFFLIPLQVSVQEHPRLYYCSCQWSGKQPFYGGVCLRRQLQPCPA